MMVKILPQKNERLIFLQSASIKKFNLFFKVLFIGLSFQFYFSTSHLSAQGDVHFSFQIFYDQLSPYGSWIHHAEYGYVWHPDLHESFMPYGDNGYWLFTEYGWTWISNYSWGWATFHYGRWFYEPYYGWLWVPGDDWSPGWVTWRRSSNYYGWAPIGPGISLTFAFSNDYYLPNHYWRFIHGRYFGNQHAENHYVGLAGLANIFSRSKVINNFRNDEHGRPIYNLGPDRVSIELHSRKSIRELAVKTMDIAGQQVNKEGLHLFMPNIKKEMIEREHSAPAHVMQWKSEVPYKVNRDLPQQVAQPPKHVNDDPLQPSPQAEYPRERPLPNEQIIQKEMEQSIRTAPVIAPPREDNGQKKIERSEDKLPVHAPAKPMPTPEPSQEKRPREMRQTIVPAKPTSANPLQNNAPTESPKPNRRQPEKSIPIKQAPPNKQFIPKKQTGNDIRKRGGV